MKEIKNENKYTEIIKEVKGFGFLNGKIKFGDFEYNVDIMTNKQFNNYTEMLKIKDGSLIALKYVLSQCLYRLETKKRLFRKSILVRKYDFDIDKYPAVMTDRFIQDLFLILLDKDFFQSLIESEAMENIEK